ATQNRPAWIVGEVYILEPDHAGGHLQRLSTGYVLDLGILRQDDEHRLDVDDRLPDIPVNHPHEIERLIELQHDQVDEHEGANGLSSVSHLGDAHQEDDNQADGENE